MRAIATLLAAAALAATLAASAQGQPAAGRRPATPPAPDALTVKQSAPTDAVGDERDYSAEPGAGAQSDDAETAPTPSAAAAAQITRGVRRLPTTPPAPQALPPAQASAPH